MADVLKDTDSTAIPCTLTRRTKSERRSGRGAATVGGAKSKNRRAKKSNEAWRKGFCLRACPDEEALYVRACSQSDGEGDPNSDRSFPSVSHRHRGLHQQYTPSSVHLEKATSEDMRKASPEWLRVVVNAMGGRTGRGVQDRRSLFSILFARVLCLLCPSQPAVSWPPYQLSVIFIPTPPSGFIMDNLKKHESFAWYRNVEAITSAHPSLPLFPYSIRERQNDDSNIENINYRTDPNHSLPIYYNVAPYRPLNLTIVLAPLAFHVG
ncbi:uncharacterized protein ARMOST_17799 [Armillaria ostoyae]|uniref:Uncharacterized protein n=1 Tax=Armillaria ostoyae TaxID=47428 RepID=A0A284S004_ARMOS|nr:uncharacterized protein ARMOST_17799 [Armillaria ostoyae]